MTDLLRNGTIIQIPETDIDNTKLVHVIQRANGLTVSNRSVLVDDLLNALYGILENFELTNLILRNGGHDLHEIFRPIFEAEESKSLFNCMKLIIDWASPLEDTSQLLILFRLLTEKFDYSNLDAETINQMLKLLLVKVNSLKDDSVFNEAFLTLLRKVNIAECKKEVIGILLDQIANRTISEKDPSIKKWFQEQITSYSPAHKAISTPLLPAGTILYQEEISGRQIVVLEIPKKQWDIQYYKTTYESVGHPKLLFEFVIKGKTIESCRIFALRNENLKSSTKLYIYPFGNVHHNHLACWPQLKTIEINRLTQLKNLPQLFFNSSTTDHLYDGKNQREKIIALQGKDFDDDVLVETGLTLADQFVLLDFEEEISE
ncbi:hypothetical protein [Paenibacillus sp. FSL P4-0288]|uniref:hypothetical protein n=1 Tax=Paenibacillus sp. FSL P4-0288 TaxID=2921633 RepID=UPI0030F93607